MKKAVLAYSGGLDTTYCLVYYSQELEMEVHTVIVNTGGFSDTELEKIEKKALKLGAHKHTAIDCTEAYYEDCIKYMIFGNVLKNNTYPLSVSSERMFQAMAIAEYAKEIEAEYIIHGSTGAGNDQVRFDVAFEVISPKTQILAPVRDEGLVRNQEIEYLKSKGVEMSWEKSKYSINKGLWGTSIGGEETLSSDKALPEEAFPTRFSKTKPEQITLQFEKGEVIALNGEKMHPIQIIQKLNEMGGQYAIGRDMHVGDTIIGIKGRVAFESPAPLMLIKAHHLLEKHTLSRWQLLHKDNIANWYGTLLHEAQYLDPAMRDFEAYLQSSQERVTGEVFLKLSPYRFDLEGIKSPFDLMQSKFANYGEDNNAWTGEDAKGFIKIFGNQLKLYHSYSDDKK